MGHWRTVSRRRRAVLYPWPVGLYLRVPEYAKGLGMSLNDAGALVSDFWMSYMFGMWAFSFILRFFDLQRILTVLAGMAAVLMYLFITGTQAHMPWFILTLGFFSSAIYTSIITLGSQQTKVASPKLVNFILTCGTIGTMLTFVVTGPIVAHSGPQAALLTANGLYAVVFVMCFVLGFVSRHRQHSAGYALIILAGWRRRPPALYPLLTR